MVKVTPKIDLAGEQSVFVKVRVIYNKHTAKGFGWCFVDPSINPVHFNINWLPLLVLSELLWLLEGFVTWTYAYVGWLKVRLNYENAKMKSFLFFLITLNFPSIFFFRLKWKKRLSVFMTTYVCFTTIWWIQLHYAWWISNAINCDKPLKYYFVYQKII